MIVVDLRHTQANGAPLHTRTRMYDLPVEGQSLLVTGRPSFVERVDRTVDPPQVHTREDTDPPVIDRRALRQRLLAALDSCATSCHTTTSSTVARDLAAACLDLARAWEVIEP